MDDWLSKGVGGLTAQFKKMPVAPRVTQSNFTVTRPMDTPSVPVASSAQFIDPGFGSFESPNFNDRSASWRDTFTPQFDTGRAIDNFTIQRRTQAQATQGGFGGLAAGNTGYVSLDAHNNEFNTSASKYGAPANLLKAMVNRESSGNWERDGSRGAVDFGRKMADGTPNYILPFVGITKAAANSWGLDFDSMIGNKQAQIDGMAKILSGLANQYGGYDNAVKVYFGGDAALRGNWNDENGLGSDYYYQEATKMWHQFDAGADELPTYNWQEAGYGSNSAVQAAMEYVGSAYVWGGIPGKGDPGGNWDCSGMTYWMDQNYGSGQLPMGSHFQFDYAQRTGNLTMDTSTLQPGDLVFFNTGNQAGAGAELNTAGHVGVYIGNGQMLHAANPTDGTIVSDFNAYTQMYQFLGGMHSAYSGGGGGGYSDPNIPAWRRKLNEMGM